MGASDIVIEVGQSLQLLGNNDHEGNIRVAGCLWLPRAMSDFTNLLKLKPGAHSREVLWRCTFLHNFFRYKTGVFAKSIVKKVERGELQRKEQE